MKFRVSQVPTGVVTLKGEDGVVRMVLTSFGDLEHLSNPTNRASYDSTIDLDAQNAWKPSGIHR